MISTILLVILIIVFAFLCFRLIAWPYNKQWEELFKAGETPKTLLGPNNESQEWSVKMVTGPIPSLDFWPFNHRKMLPFDLEGGVTWGENMTFGEQWGSFGIREQNNSFLFDYSYNLPTRPGMWSNCFVTKRIQDVLRTTPNPNVIIGKFYYKLFGKYRFLGYFTLTRRT